MTHGLLAQLRRAVRQLERDLGLERYSECERDIVCFGQESASDAGFDVGNLLADDSMRDYSRPTIFRGLKTLLDDQIIEKVGGPRSGVYRVVPRQQTLTTGAVAERRSSGSRVM